MQGVSAVDERCKKRKRKVEKTTMESSSNPNEPPDLPQSLRKKAEVIENLASKYQITIQLKETRERPRKNLSDDKKSMID